MRVSSEVAALEEVGSDGGWETERVDADQMERDQEIHFPFVRAALNVDRLVRKGTSADDLRDGIFRQFCAVRTIMTIAY